MAGGLELALWCDLRVVAADATLGVYCRRFGVPLVDLGSVRLPRLIGHSRAIDLILTGRGIDGIEAERIGLANRVAASGRRARRRRSSWRTSSPALPQRCMRNDRLSAIEQWDLDVGRRDGERGAARPRHDRAAARRSPAPAGSRRAPGVTAGPNGRRRTAGR